MKLRHWYAVHGIREFSPSPDAMLDCLRPRVPELEHQFEPAVGPWGSGCLRLSETVAPVILLRRVPNPMSAEGDRYEHWFHSLPDEPHVEHVREHMRNVRQTIHITPVPVHLGAARLARICEQLCGFLARSGDGLIQVYQEGFFSADGASLFPCRAVHRLKTN